MGQAHARDPLLPKCWPLYQCHCVCLRLSVSPAWISGRAHLWPSQPLSLKCKRVRFGTVVCRYPEVSLKGQTWALSPPAFSRSGRFYTFSIPPPSPLILVFPPNPFHVVSPDSFGKRCVPRIQKSFSWMRNCCIFGDITAWFWHIWIVNTKCDIVKLRNDITQVDILLDMVK